MGIQLKSRLNSKIVYKRLIHLIESMLEINPSSYIEKKKKGTITFNYNGKTYVLIMVGGYENAHDGLGKVKYAMSLYREDIETYVIDTYWYEGSFFIFTTFDKSKIDLWFSKDVLPNIKNIITNEVLHFIRLFQYI